MVAILISAGPWEILEHMDILSVVFLGSAFLYTGWLTLKALFQYHVHILIGAIIRPIPTFFRFLLTPFARMYVFLAFIMDGEIVDSQPIQVSDPYKVRT